jgi:chromosome segregation ATPase
VAVTENTTLKERVTQLVQSTETTRQEMNDGRAELDALLNELHIKKGENASLTELVRDLGRAAKADREMLDATAEALGRALARYGSVHSMVVAHSEGATLEDSLEALVMRLVNAHDSDKQKSEERVVDLRAQLAEAQKALTSASGDYAQQLTRVEARWQATLTRTTADLTRERDAAVMTVALTQREAGELRESLETTATELDTALRSVGSLSHEKKNLSEKVRRPSSSPSSSLISSSSPAPSPSPSS